MGETERRTQEERAAQAAAHEDAIRKTRQFARLPMDRVFHGSRDLKLMGALIGPYLDDAGDDPWDYAGFCRCLYHAFLDDTTPIPEGNAEEGIPFLGAQVSNAVVLLGLMLLDHAKGRGQEACLCTQTTLGQYLEALDALVFSKDVPLGPGFQNWRKSFLRRCSPGSPLTDVLAALLKQYSLGWKRFDAIHHILCCMEALTRELERAPEPRRQELGAYYFKQALAYSWDLPDPAGEEISAGDVREQIFLPKRDFTLQTLMIQTAEAPTQPFRTLLARILKERWQFNASPLINAAVTDLLMLFAAPYLYMGKEDPGNSPAIRGRDRGCQ